MDTPIQATYAQPLQQNISSPPTTSIMNDPENTILPITSDPPKSRAFKKVMIIILSILGIIILLFTLYVYIIRPQLNTNRLNTKGNKYPDLMTVPFMLNCKIGKKNCQCVLNYLQKNYSYSELSKDGENGNPLLTEAANYCMSLANP